MCSFTYRAYQFSIMVGFIIVCILFSGCRQRAKEPSDSSLSKDERQIHSFHGSRSHATDYGVSGYADKKPFIPSGMEHCDPRVLGWPDITWILIKGTDVPIEKEIIGEWITAGLVIDREWGIATQIVEAVSFTTNGYFNYPGSNKRKYAIWFDMTRGDFMVTSAPEDALIRRGDLLPGVEDTQEFKCIRIEDTSQFHDSTFNRVMKAKRFGFMECIYVKTR